MFPNSLFSSLPFLESDLNIFGFFLMRKEYPFALVGCDSQIHSSQIWICCREKDLVFDEQLVSFH